MSIAGNSTDDTGDDAGKQDDVGHQEVITVLFERNNSWALNLLVLPDHCCPRVAVN